MMAERNVIETMNELIDQATEGQELVARLIADDIITRLRQTDPGLLTEWLDARAGETLGAFIAARLNSRRSYARSMHSRSVFAQAAEEFEETGDKEAFAIFETWVVISPDNRRRRFGDLRKEDCEFVSAQYGLSRKEAELYERFYTKLAEKIGDRTIREVYTEAQVRAMLSSFRTAP